MASAEGGRTILFIDDDEDFVDALSRTLRRAGYRVRHAADGDEGVRMAADEPPDLVILDFMMPTKDGFDACSELRGMDSLAAVPILVLTAFGQDIGETHGMPKARALPNIQDYLEKPVEPNVLLERIAAALRKSAAKKAP